MEQLYFSDCDRDSSLKNGFTIAFVALLKVPNCLPWQQGPACQGDVSWARQWCKGMSAHAALCYVWAPVFAKVTGAMSVDMAQETEMTRYISLNSSAASGGCCRNF